jgi:hypothetical protein
LPDRVLLAFVALLAIMAFTSHKASVNAEEDFTPSSAFTEGNPRDYSA